MPKTKKAKRTEAQRAADKRYSAKNKQNQKENYKNISATFKKTEATDIADIFRANGLKTAEIIRATAQRLTDGTTTAEEVRTAAQAWTDNRPTD